MLASLGQHTLLISVQPDQPLSGRATFGRHAAAGRARLPGDDDADTDNDENDLDVNDSDASDDNPCHIYTTTTTATMARLLTARPTAPPAPLESLPHITGQYCRSRHSCRSPRNTQFQRQE